MDRYMKQELRICFVLLVVLFMMPWSALAQERGGPSVAMIVSTMKQSLQLKDEQVKGITPIITEFLKQMQSIKEERISQNDQEKQITQLKEDLRSKLERYLTKEQLEQWHNITIQTSQKEGKYGQVNKIKESSNSKDPPSNEGNLSTKDDGVLQSNSSNAGKGGVY